MKFMYKILPFMLGCLAATLSAQQVTYNYDQSANFANYHTYKWVEIAGAAYPNQIVDQQIKQAIGGQLNQKGLTPATGDNADLDVGYQIAMSQQKQLNTFGNFGGWRGMGGMGTITESTINNGTLVVDLYDPNMKQLVWRGQGTKSINPSGNQQKNLNNLNKAVAKIMKNYPPGMKH